MFRGEKAIGLGVAVVLLGIVAAMIGWSVSRGVAEDEPVGRYQAAAPDLILDTMTGRLTNESGQTLEDAIEPNGKEVGRFSAAGWVAAVTRSVGLNVMNQPTVYVDTVKGYSIVDTKGGKIVKHRTYHSQPTAPGDF